MIKYLIIPTVAAIFMVAGYGIYPLFRTDDSPPRMKEVCLEEKVQMLIPMNTGTVTVMVPIFECSRSEIQCVAGKDYEGDVVCDT